MAIRRPTRDELDKLKNRSFVAPVLTPVAEPVVEPVVEPAAEPVVEPAAEPVVEPAEAPVIEPVVEPVEAQPYQYSKQLPKTKNKHSK